MTISKQNQKEKLEKINHVMSQTDVAILLGVSRQAVQVTEQRALKKFKEKILNLYTENEICNYLNQNTFRKNSP